MLLVYGKLVIDTIRLVSGAKVSNLLGGGGPQSVLGARLFTDSVGFLTRSGTDLDPSHLDTLKGLRSDLQGWHQYPHLETPRIEFWYDQDQIMLEKDTEPVNVVRQDRIWNEILAQDLVWPTEYQAARGIHLVTEFPNETLVHQALELKETTGSLLSLEPLVDTKKLSNVDSIKSLFPRVDVLCPDLDSALVCCNTQDPLVAASELLSMGPRSVAIRAGSQGSFVADRSFSGAVHIPILEVEVVDPTGAGNAYSGAFAASLIEGASLIEAACNATAAAGAVLEVAGLPKFTEDLASQAHERANDLLQGLRF